MLLLELADDEHDFLWAFGMWAAVVACLVMWRYEHRADSETAESIAGEKLGAHSQCVSCSVLCCDVLLVNAANTCNDEKPWRSIQQRLEE